MRSEAHNRPGIHQARTNYDQAPNQSQRQRAYEDPQPNRVHFADEHDVPLTQEERPRRSQAPMPPPASYAGEPATTQPTQRRSMRDPGRRSNRTANGFGTHDTGMPRGRWQTQDGMASHQPARDRPSNPIPHVIVTPPLSPDRTTRPSKQAGPTQQADSAHGAAGWHDRFNEQDAQRSDDLPSAFRRSAPYGMDSHFDMPTSPTVANGAPGHSDHGAHHQSAQFHDESEETGPWPNVPVGQVEGDDVGVIDVGPEAHRSAGRSALDDNGLDL
jgi:hypothetical protein